MSAEANNQSKKVFERDFNLLDVFGWSLYKSCASWSLVDAAWADFHEKNPELAAALDDDESGTTELEVIAVKEGSGLDSFVVRASIYQDLTAPETPAASQPEDPTWTCSRCGTTHTDELYCPCAFDN